MSFLTSQESISIYTILLMMESDLVFDAQCLSSLHLILSANEQLFIAGQLLWLLIWLSHKMPILQHRLLELRPFLWSSQTIEWYINMHAIYDLRRFITFFFSLTFLYFLLTWYFLLFHISHRKPTITIGMIILYISYKFH